MLPGIMTYPEAYSSHDHQFLTYIAYSIVNKSFCCDTRGELISSRGKGDTLTSLTERA